MNKTNATVEHFLSLKKSNPLEMRLPLPEFIENCWKDNKGLWRQFINGMEAGIKERTTFTVVRKCTVDHMKQYVVDVEENENNISQLCFRS